MKIVTVGALANFVKNPDHEHIISSAFDQGTADVAVEAVKSA